MRGKWSNNEIKFLIDEYIKQGPEYCANKLNRTINSVKKQAARNGLKYKTKRYQEEEFTKIVLSSRSYSDVARKLDLTAGHGNRTTIIKYIKHYNIDISHFDYGSDIPKNTNRKKIILEEVLVKDSPYPYTTNLKYKLYNEGLKTHLCEICGQSEMWNGKKMSLILDHINGINDDNRLENLRIVCPNCNATLDTHCNKKRKI